MKIAFINQPWGIAEPQPVGDSINIWTYNVARHLSESHDVFVYGVNRGFSQKTVRTYAGIQYRGFTARLDRLVLNKALSKLNSFLKKSVLPRARTHLSRLIGSTCPIFTRLRQT